MVNFSYYYKGKKLKVQMEVSIFQHPDFAFIQKLLKQFPRAEMFLVGGAVRDGMLGIKEIKDYDFVVRNVAAKDLEVFLKTLGTVNLVGKTFGVFKFVPHSFNHCNPNHLHNRCNHSTLEPIDIALPRKEKSTKLSGGYRDFEVQSDPSLPIEDDLERRDFTINAMALRITNQYEYTNMIDPFHGLKDLKNKIIRAVGKPEQRFKEDYSRILRAIRFACQLSAKGGPASGWTIEKKTWNAIQKLSRHLNDVSEVEYIVPRETIGKEFVQAFFRNPVMAFDLFDKSELFKILLPGILKMKNCPQPKQFHAEGDVWTHTRIALEKLPPDANANLIIAMLFHDIGKPFTIKTPEQDGVDRIRFNGHDKLGAKMAKEICSGLKLTQFAKDSPLHIDPEQVGWLIEHHMLLVSGKIEEMKASTIEKYFFSEKYPGKDLLKLSFADISATIPPSSKPDFISFYKMRERIGELKKLGKEKEKLPPALLSGDEVMEQLKIPPGPKVGKFLTALREAQLEKKIKTKKEAKEFLCKSSIKTLTS